MADMSMTLQPGGMSNSGASRVVLVNSTTSVVVVKFPCSDMMVVVCLSGWPIAALPPPFITMRSLQLARPPIPPQVMERYDSSAQENPAERSAYQPSVSIFMFDLLQASGLDSMIREVLMW